MPGIVSLITRSLKSSALFGTLACLLAASAFAAEKSTAPQLIALANSNSPALLDAITATFDAKDLKDATAWIARGHITNQLLRTVSIMNKENAENPQIICDMPCPERDRVPPPEPTYADLRT